MSPGAARVALVAVSIATLFSGGSAAAAPRTAVTRHVYVGTYAPKQGIVRLRLDIRQGTLTGPRPTAADVNPAFLVPHPNGQCLYAACLVPGDDGNPTGGVAAFAIDPVSDDLREIDRRPSGGTGPCYLSLDAEGRCLLAAHCGSATVACLALQPDGRFGSSTSLIPHRGISRNSEQKPQAHSIRVAPGDRFAVAADLGLDTLFVYRLDCAVARLTPHVPPAVPLKEGAGPRHLAFHPRGTYAYSVNELDNTVTALRLDRERGTLETFQNVSTLPADFQGESYAADVQVHPNGKQVYATNRGHDSIAMFAIDETSGKLQARGQVPSGGKFPRSIAIDPAGAQLIVANQKSDCLTLFDIDAQTGQLEAHGDSIPIPQPVCVQIMPRR